MAGSTSPASVGAAAFVWVLAIGCADRSSTGPPEVYFGQDVCAACNMIVSEAGYASALVVRTGDDTVPHVFDDIGCLFLWAEKNAGATVEARWVRDVRGSGWLTAESAFYVRGSGIRSPMGSGVAACATPEDATELARERDGQRLTWAELVERAGREGLLVPPPAAGRSQNEARSRG